MNSTISVSSGKSAGLATNLLQTIGAIRSSIGDGLNEFELTWLLHDRALPKEAGFGFLSYSEQTVTLSVPEQDLTGWYPEKGWIRAEKEAVAHMIAKKHNLSLCEPPDTLNPWYDSPNRHHHLELSDGRDTIIVAHSQYLKIRLFIAVDRVHNPLSSQKPVALSPYLLQDLSTLYQTVDAK